MTIYDSPKYQDFSLHGGTRKAVSKKALAPRWEQEAIELDEFYQNWYNEIGTIRKVIKLEKSCGRPIDLFYLHISHVFTNAQIDWIYEQGTMRWLYGPISTRPIVDGEKELCSIIRLCPQRGGNW